MPGVVFAGSLADVLFSEDDPLLSTPAGGVEEHSGSGSITSTATLTATGTKGGQGTGTITSSATVTGTGAEGGQGAATITATTALTGTGAAARQGTGTTSATAAVTGTGGEATRSGAGAITSTAVGTGTGTTTRSGGGSIGSTGTLTGSTGSQAATRPHGPAVWDARPVIPKEKIRKRGGGRILCRTHLTGRGVAHRHGDAGYIALLGATLTGAGHSPSLTALRARQRQEDDLLLAGII